MSLTAGSGEQRTRHDGSGDHMRGKTLRRMGCVGRRRRRPAEEVMPEGDGRESHGGWRWQLRLGVGDR
jgi:hypothetical protein